MESGSSVGSRGAIDGAVESGSKDSGVRDGIEAGSRAKNKDSGAGGVGEFIFD